ncbi:hypothetical protein [Peptostreptococcus faecalis]|uniref:hypothetical protein n=1 Tax=Peptostreptococcus faecalis TaxID=2045015 RepID=UPI000C7AA098|nr:hypothetical protein [Peptostreptococcus faecalis]
MEKILKLVKNNFRENRKIFYFATALYTIFLFIFYLYSSFRTVVDMEYRSINGGIRIDTFDYNILLPPIYIIVIVTIMFLLMSLYKRLYNDDGSFYNILQLPVQKYFHVVSIFIETYLFIIIQYAIFILFSILFLKYINHSIDEINFMNNAIIENKINIMQFIYNSMNQSTLFKLSYANILYRFLITWPLLISYCSLIFILIYKYKDSFIFKAILIAMIFIIIIDFFDNSFIFTESILSILISDMFFKEILISLGALISIFLLDIYLLKNKIDF